MDDTQATDDKATRESPALWSLGPQSQPLVSLTRELNLIGSAESVQVRLRSAAVGRHNAAVINCGDRLYVRDLTSRANVFVNGIAVREADLVEGDTLKVGPFEFRVYVPSEGGRASQFVATGAFVRDSDGIETPLNSRTLLIGRTERSDLRLDNSSVSAAHALVFWLNGVHHIRDLHSRTGTRVNGRPVRQLPLQSGDIIEVGPGRITFLSVPVPAGNHDPVEDSEVRKAPTPDTDVREAQELPSLRVCSGSKISPSLGEELFRADGVLGEVAVPFCGLAHSLLAYFRMGSPASHQESQFLALPESDSPAASSDDLARLPDFKHFASKSQEIDGADDGDRCRETETDRWDGGLVFEPEIVGNTAEQESKHPQGNVGHPWKCSPEVITSSTTASKPGKDAKIPDPVSSESILLLLPSVFSNGCLKGEGGEDQEFTAEAPPNEAASPTRWVQRIFKKARR